MQKIKNLLIDFFKHGAMIWFFALSLLILIPQITFTKYLILILVMVVLQVISQVLLLIEFQEDQKRIEHDDT